MLAPLGLRGHPSLDTAQSITHSGIGWDRFWGLLDDWLVEPVCEANRARFGPERATSRGFGAKLRTIATQKAPQNSPHPQWPEGPGPSSYGCGAFRSLIQTVTNLLRNPTFLDRTYSRIDRRPQGIESLLATLMGGG